MKFILVAVFAVVACSFANATDLPFQCNKEQDAFYPSPDDCQAFYHCKDGEATLKLCPKGLHYNSLKQQCDLEKNVDCSASFYISEEPQYTGEEVTSYPSYVKCSSMNCRCVFKNGHCDKYYYECIRLKVYKKMCSDSLIFNERIGGCDLPENIPECSSICPIIRRPLDCTCIRSYNTCCDGEYVIKTCPDGHAFNLATKECDTHTFLTSCGGTVTTCSCEGKNYAHDTDCRAYYTCTKGNIMIPKRCPSGTAFNKATGFCDPTALLTECGVTTSTVLPTSTDGTTAHGKCEKFCIHDGEYPHPTHCRRWCHCSNGLYYEKQCPGATHFSVVHKRCESPGVAACGLPIKFEI